jgi:preprotein translocase subunit SecE
MDFTKLLSFRRLEEEEVPLEKVQKPKAAKKSSQSTAGKPKKADLPKKTPKKSDEPRFAWVQAARDYLREVVYELRKVVWPSRKETIGSTIVVLVIVIISGVYLGVVDLVLSRLIRMVVG